MIPTMRQYDFVEDGDRGMRIFSLLHGALRVYIINPDRLRRLLQLPISGCV